MRDGAPISYQPRPQATNLAGGDEGQGEREARGGEEAMRCSAAVLLVWERFELP